MSSIAQTNGYLGQYEVNQIGNYFWNNNSGKTAGKTGTMILSNVVSIDNYHCYGITSGNTQTFQVTYSKFQLKGTEQYFWGSGWSGTGSGIITLRFEQVQTISSFATGSFGNKSSRFRIQIKSGSSNVSGNTWSGVTFNSITLN